ncbi:MAG: tandem-95 repeat protein [Candidatus Scalindua sp. SCAELEC01]|nr:MAG: tandem-95 repeat protein [Candidatus Scalindua sp. SCAELEC01]
MGNKISANTNTKQNRWFLRFRFCFSLFFLFLLITEGAYGQCSSSAKYIILMIADGNGIKHNEATNTYTGTIPYYQTAPEWSNYFVSTYHFGGDYNTTSCWNDFNYVISQSSTRITDSAAAASAIYSGTKTAKKNISVTEDDVDRLLSIGEIAKTLNKAVGAVTTVPLSHATPGAWTSHNDLRTNGYAIADEGLFGDPNTTGTSTENLYAGGHGQTFPTVDVLIGDSRSGYVNTAIRNKVANDNIYTLVERITGVDGGSALLSAANTSGVTKLAGLFDHIYHTADDSAFAGDVSTNPNLENPTLVDSTTAALTVLNRNTNGFILMIEGGAVDWASHSNIMDEMIGEKRDFDAAAQAVIDWVENTSNGSSWSNTLVIITADHETGYLTTGTGFITDTSDPRYDPNDPLGTFTDINDTTLALEKIVSGTGGRRASWIDTNTNNLIDAGETVYWVWNDGNHSNSLVPLYVRGIGAGQFATHATGTDTYRGAYLDNTNIFDVMNSVILNAPTNTSPVSTADSATTDEDTLITINVIANDYDIDGTVDPTTVTILSVPNQGTATPKVDGTVDYTPTTGYAGLDTFTYTVDDVCGGSSNISTVTVTIDTTNVAPTAVNDPEMTTEDTLVNIDVLGNDTDSDGTIDPTSVAIVSVPTNGTAVAQIDGTVDYTPTTGYTGQDTFTYTVDDNLGATSNVATVTVTVNATNVIPVAVNDSAATTENALVTINVTGNDTDSDGTIDPATVTIISLPTNGAAVAQVDGTVDYAPNNGYTGQDTFTYTVDDNLGATSNEATVTITVNSGDTPWMASPTPASTVTTSTVLFQWNAGTQENLYRLHVGTSPGGKDILWRNNLSTTSYTVTGIPINGNTVYVRLWYRIGTHWSFIDYTYQTQDSVNQPPSAVDDPGTTTEETLVTINVIGNDTDSDGTIDPDTVTIVAAPTNGTAVPKVDGTVDYTPNTGFTGQDTFTYTVDDNLGAISNVATVTVTVNANVAPVAVNDPATTTKETLININVIGNDTDSDGTIDPVTVTIISVPTNGAAVPKVDGTVDYTPTTGYTGQDSFTYTVDDNLGATSNVATVTVTVNATNVAPVAVNDSVTTTENSLVTINIIGNDTDSDGTIDATTVAIVSVPSNGSAVAKVDGTVDYTPTTGYTGQDTFTYTVDDNLGATSNVATVTVTVNATNVAPVAVNDSAVTTENALVNINVISNDTDSDGTIDPATVTIVGVPTNGSAVSLVNGTADYTPNTGFTGQDSFTYTIDDNLGATSNVTTVTITVNSGDTPWMASPTPDSTVTTSTVLFQWNAGTQENLYRLHVGTSPGGKDILWRNNLSTTSYTVTGIPINGNTVYVRLWYRIGTKWSFIDYTYQTQDSVNQPPSAVNDLGSTTEETLVTINVIGNDTDSDGTIDPATVTIVAAPTNGTAVPKVDGTVDYTPNTGFTGQDTFTYTVDDNLGAISNVATVTVTVNANVAPVAVNDPATTTKETLININVIGNDTDSDGTIDPVTVTIISVPTNGAAVPKVDGTVDYTPTTGYTGQDSFTYTVDDNLGATSNVATVTVTVNATNVAPVAVNDSVTTTENSLVTINIIGNDTDSDGTIDATTVAIVSVPSNGSGVAKVDGTVDYTPTTGYTGQDSFTYTVDDNLGATSNVATVAVTVNATNVAPVAVNDSAVTTENALVNINVISNDTDSDGTIDPATMTIVGVPTNGSAVSLVNGTADYTPNTGFTGQDSFTYTIDDNLGATSNVATVTMTVNSGDTPWMDSPTPGSTVTTSTVLFQWNAGTQENLYRIHVGTTGPGSKNILKRNNLSETSYTVTGIPITGNTVYVRLWYRIGTKWSFIDYTYQT